MHRRIFISDVCVHMDLIFWKHQLILLDWTFCINCSCVSLFFCYSIRLVRRRIHYTCSIVSYWKRFLSSAKCRQGHIIFRRRGCTVQNERILIRDYHKNWYYFQNLHDRHQCCNNYSFQTNRNLKNSIFLANHQRKHPPCPTRDVYEPPTTMLQPLYDRLE